MFLLRAAAIRTNSKELFGLEVDRCIQPLWVKERTVTSKKSDKRYTNKSNPEAKRILKYLTQFIT
jgi:hypothetical protein